MSYFPRMPPPRQYYEGYYTGQGEDYSYYGGGYAGGYEGYGSYGYGGGYGPPRPPRGGGAWRGRGRGGWSSLRGGSSSSPSGGGGASSTLTTVKTVSSTAATAPANNTATTATAVKTENAAATVKTENATVQVKTEPQEQKTQPSATAAKPSAVPNGGAAPAGGQTTTTSATNTRTTAMATATGTAATATAATATAGKAADSPAIPAKPTVDTPLTNDHPFPESVTEKFFPNRCDLCSVVFPVAKDIVIPEKGGLDYMESNLQSTMHYSGKSHKKHLRQFMQDYCRRRRIMPPQKARELMRDTPAIPRPTDAKEKSTVDLYCKTCDLSFTSVQHASQHYAGKNHQRKLEGKPPLKTGYFNPRTGRWQRLPPGMEHERYASKPAVMAVVTGGIRPVTASSSADQVSAAYTAQVRQAAARYAPATVTPSGPGPNVVMVQVAPENLVNAGGKVSSAASSGTTSATATTAAGAGSGAQSKFYCRICAVSATCQLQLDTHMTGARHKLRARQLGIPVPPPAEKPAATASTTEPAAAAATTTTGEPAAKRAKKDYSSYKTPSGKFYCLPCDLTMNSEVQFAQHFESKKHQIEVTKQRKAGVVAA